MFGNHAIVQYTDPAGPPGNLHWYDPSYAIPYPSPTLESVQKTSIAGFYLPMRLFLTPKYSASGKPELAGLTYVFLMEKNSGTLQLKLGP